VRLASGPMCRSSAPFNFVVVFIFTSDWTIGRMSGLRASGMDGGERTPVIRRGRRPPQPPCRLGDRRLSDSVAIFISGTMLATFARAAKRLVSAAPAAARNLSAGVAGGGGGHSLFPRVGGFGGR
jgi:hypothetical protein